MSDLFETIQKIIYELLNSSEFSSFLKFCGGTCGVVISLVILFLFSCILYSIICSWIKALFKIYKFKSIFNKYDFIDRNNLNEISTQFKKIKKDKVWQKFYNNLVIQKDKSGEERFYTIYPVKDFFDLNLFGGKLVSNKFITIMPSLLTGLGLFGTFLGLTLNLSGLNLDNISGDTKTQMDAIKVSINTLLTGASTAFSTSLFGIATSLLINFFDKLAISSLKNKLSFLRSKVYDLFPQIKLEENFIRIEEYNANMNEIMETLAEKIGDRMQQGMLEATSQMNKSISEALDKLVVSTQSWGDRVTSGSEGVLSSLITEFVDKIGENATSQRELMEQSSNKMADVVSSLDNMMQQYNTMTNNSFDNIKKQQEEANKKHMENLDTYRTSLMEVSENTFQNQEKQTQIMDKLLDKCSGVSEGLFVNLSNLKYNLENINDSITKIINKFSDTVDKFDSSSSKLEQAGDVFSNAGEKLVEPMNNTIKSFENVSHKNLEIQDRIKSISDDLQDILSGCEDTVDSVNTLLNNSNNTFNSLSKSQNDFLNAQKENLNNLSLTLKSNFETYTDSLKKQTEERLEQWNEKTQQFSSAMRNTVQAIQSVVDNIETKLK